MDTLTIQKIWEDPEFFQIEIVAQSGHIRASTRSYTTEDLIHELAKRLVRFPQSINDRFIWENGIKGDNWTPFVSLEFWCEDKLGHVVIEVFMEFDDGASFDKHNCCFYLKTEIGLLNRFGKSLELLNERGLGKKIDLLNFH